MSRVLVNAVSAKHGGARTIVESLVAAAATQQHSFIVLAGYEPDAYLPPNVSWHYLPKSGALAVVFSLIGVAFYFARFRADKLISLNNINTPLVPARRRLTYFHQLKALDSAFSEPKVRAIRSYLRHSSEPVIVQSAEVKSAFENMFGTTQRELIVAWPGVPVFPSKAIPVREARVVVVPVASPQSSHKNFSFVQAVAQCLGRNWRVLVTAGGDSVDLKGEAGNIEFIGVLPRGELFERYRCATVCLMGSTHETIGLPIFEALAVGTPVVAYDATYIRSLRSQFGISEGLFLAKTPEAAAAEIEALAQNSVPRIVAEREFCDAQWDIILDRL